MNGHEVCRQLTENPETAATSIVYMSGFGADLSEDTARNPNVIGTLHKPFTSDLLLQTVEKYLPRTVPEIARIEPTESAPEKPLDLEHAVTPSAPLFEGPAPVNISPIVQETVVEPVTPPVVIALPSEPVAALPDGVPCFSGDTDFFSLGRALQAIASEKLTGVFRATWSKQPVELFARDGHIILVSSRDPELYCPEAPITLLNVDVEKNMAARQVQTETGCPLFLTLAQEGLILKEPALDLVQHYGQKLFALLWTAGRVRFTFEKTSQFPEWAADLSPTEDDVDHWMLNTLRFTQYHELGDGGGDGFDPAAVPAYTRSGYERIQHLRLTVAEAQFASQFNGSRSTQQIAKNLRLDLKFARLTLFRFIALEIVECWPETAMPSRESGGVFRRLLGLGD